MTFQALIASDEESLVRRVSAALGEMGLSVESVPESEPALALLKRRQYEAVFLDCDLEGAMHLVGSVRDDSPNQRAIVLAFASDPEAARSANKGGANFVLAKPINWEVAKRTLRAAHTMIIRERRRSIRERVCFVASLNLEGQSIRATVTDISDGGLAIRVPAEIPNGSEIEVRFKFSKTAEPVSCTGFVAWSKGKFVGMEFSHVPPTSARAIIKWLVCNSHHRVQRLVTQNHANRALDWGF
jgi:ActR/RegA family two-component response regulator